MQSLLKISLRIVCCGLIAGLASAAEPKDPKAEAPYSPLVREASKEGENAIRRFQYDKSLKVELWAAEPMLANPVCFCFDEKGRCYVAETFRHTDGAIDNRGKPWLEDELASRTVEERVAMLKKYAKQNFSRAYEKEHDRVRLIEDTTGSGRADKATVFRDDFGKAEDGIGAGLLARNGEVFYACIPGLFKLKDTKGTGQADVKETLSTGYGVHVAYIGHDLHGLRMGPDGKLYFSVGDRGLNVKTKEGRHLFYPDTGAVLRCDPDGANLEVVHMGLRNPQELAFDDYGNLFTVDNNSDSGDRARFVQIVEGGDSGWRLGYQYGSEMHDPKVVRQGNRGPWNYEKLWYPHFEGQAAYIVPPLNNFADGPSGFTHYPGVGLAEKYQGHFFLCDFRGNSNGSGVWSFTTKPKGASFEMVNPQHFVWRILCTDCDFGPDCNFYISDWAEGWNKTGKGRIYKVSDPEEQKKGMMQEVKKLLADGFKDRPIAELVELLSHSHQQVRLEAQFALVAKGNEAFGAFYKVAKESKNQLARLHAIWGLKQLTRGHKVPIAMIRALFELSSDNDAEIRAQAARALRPSQVPDVTSVVKRLSALLADPEPRVRFFAAESLATIDFRQEETMASSTQDALVSMLRANEDKDPYLRHAGSRALANLLALSLDKHKPSSDPSTSVRLAILLAHRMLLKQNPTLRQAASSLLSPSLLDSDPRIVAEAARAIHDEDLMAAYPALATMTTKSNLGVEVLYRALNAHFRLGQPENAAALATFAAKSDNPELLRILALKMLAAWPKPPRRDFITGLTQDMPPRDATVAAKALQAKLGGVFAGSANIQKEAASTASKLGITEVGPFLFNLVSDAKVSASTRIEALKALASLKDQRIADAVSAALAANDPKLRNAGRAILLKSKPDEAVKQLKDVLAKDNIVEKQGALALLANAGDSDVDDLLEGWLDKLIKKEAPPELHLDILESVAKRKSTRLQRRLQSFEEARPKNDELGKFRETLFGGDADRGRQIFLNKMDVSCQRCHKLDGEGGEVGPPLNGIAAKQQRDYLLEAIVLPNKQIAKGYDSVLITKTDGKSVTGVLKSEDDKEVKVMTAEGQLITVKKEDIEERKATKSAMPDDVVQKLTKHELRDLVEFLAGLKEEWKK